MKKQHLPIKMDDDNIVILTWVLDPLSVHVPKFCAYEDLIYRSSMIREWVSGALRQDIKVLDGLKKGYIYWCETGAWDNCSIDDNGVLLSPEDPDLYPLILFRNKSFKVYIYEYDIVAVIEDGNTTITRMD